MRFREAEIIADGIKKSSKRNSKAIITGFRESSKEIGKSLGGTRAELMNDCLLKLTRNGKIPRRGSRKWSRCKKMAIDVLEEFK